MCSSHWRIYKPGLIVMTLSRIREAATHPWQEGAYRRLRGAHTHSCSAVHDPRNEEMTAMNPVFRCSK